MKIIELGILEPIRLKSPIKFLACFSRMVKFYYVEDLFLESILYMLIQTFSATDEEIKSFVCKKGNINS